MKTFLFILTLAAAVATGWLLNQRVGTDGLTAGYTKTKSFLSNTFGSWLHTERIAAADAGAAIPFQPKAEA